MSKVSESINNLDVLSANRLDVNFEQLNQKVAYTSAWLGMPIPLQTKAWTCRSCGHRWQDRDGLEPGDSEQP